MFSSNPLMTLGALILANLLYGSGYPCIKIVTTVMKPAPWIFIRSIVATALVFLLLRKKIFEGLSGFKIYGTLFIASIFGIMINHICFAEGIYRSSSAHTAMINATIPLQTLVFAKLLLNERFSIHKLLAVILGMTGVAYLIGLKNVQFHNQVFVGDMLAVANSASFSLFLVLSKKYLSHLKPWVVLFWINGFGMLGFGVYTDWYIPYGAFENLSAKIYFCMFYLLVIPSLVAYALNLWALKKVDSSQAALFSYLQPLSASFFSWIALNEIPEPKVYVSAVLILLALLVGSWHKE